MNNIELEILNKITNEFLSHIDYMDDDEIEYYHLISDTIICEMVDKSYGGDYKKIVEWIGTYKVLKETDRIDVNCILRESEFEMEFYRDIFYYYIYYKHLDDIMSFVEIKYKQRVRLHYNRYLKQSNLPDDICDMIREHL